MPMPTQSGTQLVKLRVMGREVVVAVTNSRLDGFAQLAGMFGTWERIFSGQAEWLARES
jgi:hypothetical protein